MGNTLHRSRRRFGRDDKIVSKSRFMKYLRNEGGIDPNSEKNNEISCCSLHDSGNDTPYGHSCDDAFNDSYDVIASKRITSLFDDDHDTTTVYSYPFDEIDSFMSEADDYFNYLGNETVSKHVITSKSQVVDHSKRTNSNQSTCTSHTEKCHNSFHKQASDKYHTIGTKSREIYSDLDNFTKFLGSFLDLGDQNRQKRKNETSPLLFPDDQFFQCDWTVVPCPSLISNTSSFSSNSSSIYVSPIRKYGKGKSINKRDVSFTRQTSANVHDEDIISNGSICCSDEMMFVSNSFDEALWSIYRKYDDYCYDEKNVYKSYKRYPREAVPIKAIKKECRDFHFYYGYEDQLAPSDEEDERLAKS
jgi:hypothetical protein